MAGTCFTLSMLDSIICQSFYQPGALFRYFLEEKKVIPLGLYRTKRMKTSDGNIKRIKYVYTCPKYNVLLRDDDKVFVLSKRMPTY